jgi:hypothetical protein
LSDPQPPVPTIPGKSLREFVRSNPNLVSSLGLFLFLLVVYHLNGGSLPFNDIVPNANLPVRILTRGSLTFTPEENPSMFIWGLKLPEGEQPVSVDRWDQTFRNRSARECREAGILVPRLPRYYLWPARTAGTYAGIYGPVAGLCGLPAAAVASLFASNIAEDRATILACAKFTGAALSAGSAVLVFLAAMAYASRRASWILSLVYGLGTAVWSEASQGLWQQSASLFFLALGAFFLTRLYQGKPYALATGLAFGTASFARPTCVLAAAAIGILILLSRRNVLFHYLAGFGLLAAGIGIYNLFFFGSLFAAPQVWSARNVASFTTGSSEVWQTPLWLGAAGSLISPSRGLFVFSPILLFSLWGGWASWKHPAGLPLRGLGVALSLLMLVSFKWFMWWGGPTYGARFLTDLLPFFAILIAPVADRILEQRILLAGAVVLTAWSLAVHGVGAFAFEQNLWNAKSVYEVRVENRLVGLGETAEAARQLAPGREASIRQIRLDIGLPEYRHRLWSVTDNQIFYFMSHFTEARRVRRRAADASSGAGSPR